MYIDGIGQAVLLSFKVGSGNHQLGNLPISENFRTSSVI